MALALAAVAFSCAALLACLLPAYWSSRNVAMLALIWWLIICNIIQGVNVVFWAGNVEVRIPVWCDIGTKLLLGVRVALPSACLCLSNRVRHLLVTGDARGGIGVLSFDLTMCIIVPVVYMVLHIIVQSHRFNLTENFGCSPAVYNSVPALFLVWLPPLVLSVSAIVLTCVTIRCGHRRGFTLLRTSRSASSGRHIFDFLRPLLRSFLIASLFLASSAFTLHAALASSPLLLPWTSWRVVHAHLSQANIIRRSAALTVSDIKVTWWMIPASSFVLIGMFLVNLARASREDNSLEGYRTMVWRASILFTGKNEVRPLSTSSSVMDLQPQMSSKRSSETLMSIHPMYPDHKGSTNSRSRARVKLPPLSIPSCSDKAASPPTSISSDDTDISFAQSAMSYLDSPVGRAAIASMPRPPSIFRPSNIPGHLPDMPPPAVVADAVAESALRNEDEIHRSGSRRRPSSIIAGPWPRPPTSLPPSPVKLMDVSPISPTRPNAMPPIAPDQVVTVPSPVVHRLRPPSSTSVDVSLVSSTVSTSAYALEPPPDALHDSPTLPHFAPFADAGVPASYAHASRTEQFVPRHARRTRSRDGLPALGRTLSLSGLRGRDKRSEGLDGGVYMTVVQETV
ncbi:pheromone A receptor-domain-containing protein [Rhodofomes roseus]|uniref:Pheromone A receptor-domain-containing protein n=1 Tax=Rhodofomes roseus TaxID=34475 RepID=A0ABQ8KIN8_9APHY|nr:pheromone A receptor-domain-containing protein [Rhodofomes roseus]KAH9837860.1 pheromone A receptor-domain-containing protein [Rhodofomes roseus]